MSILMTTLDEMSEGEFFAQLRKRPGMYVGPAGVSAMASLLTGYDLHAARHGDPRLDGLGEMADRQGCAVESRVVGPDPGPAFSGRSGSWEQHLSAEETAAEVDGMLRLSGEFIAERDGHEPIVLLKPTLRDPHVRISSIVLYTTRIEECRDFYAAFGLYFRSEQHGDGPRHYSALLIDGTLLELYPATPENATGRARLGLTINGAAAKPEMAPGRYVLTDPDGRRIEVYCPGQRRAH